MFQTDFVENIKTHFLCPVTFSENRAVYEIMWKNIVEPNRPQMTIWRMRIACWILKATDATQNMYYLLFFLLQQWLHERVSMVHCTYPACLVITAQNMKISGMRY